MEDEWVSGGEGRDKLVRVLGVQATMFNCILYP